MFLLLEFRIHFQKSMEVYIFLFIYLVIFILTFFPVSLRVYKILSLICNTHLFLVSISNVFFFFFILSYKQTHNTRAKIYIHSRISSLCSRVVKLLQTIQLYFFSFLSHNSLHHRIQLGKPHRAHHHFSIADVCFARFSRKTM